MKYKMVVSDFDDTLLRKDYTVSAGSIRAIRAFMDRGGIFTISTGRNIDSIMRQLPAVGLGGINIPVMSLNGGFVIESESKQVLRKVTIPYETALEIALKCEADNIYFHLYDEHSAYVREEHPINIQYQQHTGTGIRIVGLQSDYIRKGKIDCIKILVVDTPQKLKSIQASFDGKYPALQIFPSHEYLLEMVSAQSGKGAGLRFVAERMGIDLSEVIAIGDSMNDYSLLETAGLGVAVENAVPALKAIAGHIAPSCDEDGVADTIERFCL